MDLAAFKKALGEGRIRKARSNEAVAIGTSATLLLRANPRRCGYRFSHQSANPLHFAEDPEVTNATGDSVERGVVVVQDFEAAAGGIGMAIWEEVWAAFETGAGTVFVTEYEVDA